MLVDSLMDRLADTLASVDPSEQTVISHVLLVELAQHGIDLHQWLLDWYQSAGKHAWQLAYGW